jgi:hypothetical protein
LCHEDAAEDVSAHLAREEEGFGGPAFSIIKELHPDWLEEHGACGSCWSFYANLVRVLNASGSFDARFQISPSAPRKTNRAGHPREGHGSCAPRQAAFQAPTLHSRSNRNAGRPVDKRFL